MGKKKPFTLYFSHSVKGHFELISIFCLIPSDIAGGIPGACHLVIMGKSFSKTCIQEWNY